MPEHVWSVLCNRALTDRDSNQVSLIGVCEKVIVDATLEDLKQEEKGAGGRIAAPVQLDLVCWWVRSDYEVPEDAKGRIRVVTPDGEEIKSEYDIKLVESAGWRPTIKVLQFPISHGPGLYWFENQVLEAENWDTRARLPVEVEFKETGNSDSATTKRK